MSALSAKLARPWRRPRAALGFSSRGLITLPAQGRATRREVPAGLLVPSSTTPNIHSVSEMARLASQMIDELGIRGATVSILLPDLAVVSAVLPSTRSSTEPQIRSELASRLGFPASEARSDFWRGGKGEVLGAAVREAVVRQYEQVVEATECRIGWVDAASLAGIPAWADAARSDVGVALLEVLLYQEHYMLVIFRRGELIDVRTRLRSGDDIEVVAGEIQRIPALYELDDLGTIAVSGNGASACARLLAEAGLGARISVEYEGEERQLEGSLAALLHRS